MIYQYIILIDILPNFFNPNTFHLLFVSPKIFPWNLNPKFERSKRRFTNRLELNPNEKVIETETIEARLNKCRCKSTGWNYIPTHRQLAWSSIILLRFASHFFIFVLLKNLKTRGMWKQRVCQRK